MSSLLDQLNLRPQERRLLVVVAIIVFLALNVIFVRPHFSDWSRLEAELAKAQTRLTQFETEAGKTKAYESRLKALEGQGSTVLPEDQANNLVRAIQSQATQSRVFTTRVSPKITPRTGPGTTGSNTSTNQFFEEQTVFVGVANTGDKEIVDFLVALSSGDLMVRVRDLDLRPDPTSGNSKLTGTISLVASYQKKPKASTPSPKKS